MEICRNISEYLRISRTVEECIASHENMRNRMKMKMKMKIKRIQKRKKKRRITG
jgi:hypothetical protein